jgi:hypothetical protein
MSRGGGLRKLTIIPSITFAVESYPNCYPVVFSLAEGAAENLVGLHLGHLFPNLDTREEWTRAMTNGRLELLQELHLSFDDPNQFDGTSNSGYFLNPSHGFPHLRRLTLGKLIDMDSLCEGIENGFPLLEGLVLGERKNDSFLGPDLGGGGLRGLKEVFEAGQARCASTLRLLNFCDCNLADDDVKDICKITEVCSNLETLSIVDYNDENTLTEPYLSILVGSIKNREMCSNLEKFILNVYRIAPFTLSRCK